jgi:membrane-bound lytic murein transglycosylase D
MNRLSRFHSILLFIILLVLPCGAIGANAASTDAGKAGSEDITALLGNYSNVPMGVRDLVFASRAKYLEGSGLIKAGESDKARESFNKAVDLLLQSNWDLTSTPVLNRYFQDLIQRIQEDESLYLVGPCETDDPVESAVVDDLRKVDLIPATVKPALEDALSSDLANNQYEIPITMNAMVLKSLDFWLNQGRKYFVDGYLRSGQYRPIIEKVFREESIPLDLMYLAQVESLFKPHAVSKAQAKGIWQFERATALRYGLKVNRDVDERSDPEKSTRAAARYLNDLFDMFKDWNLALAAYNWGEGKVQRLMDSTGLNDFWQLVDLKRRLPEETKNHVPLIQASVILARNPEKYGLPTELDPPLKYAEVNVSKPIDLRAAAKVLSTSIEELKKLNPALRGLTTPANYPNFQLKVPVGSDPKTHDRLADLPTVTIRPLPEYNCRHKIRPGETMSGIAARYHISAAELARANNLSANKKLVAGTWLQVPSQSALRDAPAPAKARSVAAGKSIPKSLRSKNSGSTRVNSATVQSKSRKPVSKAASSKTRTAGKDEPRQIASK